MSIGDFILAQDRQRLGMLLAAVMLIVLPHTANLESSIMAYVGLLLIWRGAALFDRAGLPNRWLLLLLTMAGAGLVYAEYHRFYGREAGAALFTVGLSLKLMELKSSRDAYLVVFLACFVAVTQFLFSQSIAMAAYALAIVMMLVASLIGFNSPDTFTPRQRLKFSAVMVGQALPLMIILFIFFPRIAGPLWKLPDDTPQATSGLSDTVEPGAISRLALSQAPAFRVDFNGGRPPPSKLLYWRGPVFWKTDGHRWTLAAENNAPPPTPIWRGPAVAYTVTLEPHQQHWVLALDMPSAFPSTVRQSGDYQLLARDKLNERARFRLESHTDYNTGELTPREIKLGLELPRVPSMRMKTLIEGWQAENREPAQIVQQALRHFREDEFFYTLNPPPLGDDPVDEFLFESRRGFCEHYATAFVVLMRAAGLPARLVTGYQGGQWNNVGRFLEVKQADAHAWVEVWLQGQGWTRIDPTAAVAPERIERGLDVDTQIAEGEIRFNLPEGALGQGSSLLSGYWRQSRMLWASIDHRWNQWVLSYGPENQARLLQRLGVFDWRGLAGWLAGGLGLAGGLISLWILPRRPPRPEQIMRIYGQFLRKLARRGHIRQPAEGALDFARRIEPTLSHGATDDMHRIVKLFIRIRYGRESTLADVRELKRLVRSFRP